MEPNKEQKLEYVLRQIDHNTYQLKERSLDLAILMDWLKEKAPHEFEEVSQKLRDQNLSAYDAKSDA